MDATWVKSSFSFSNGNCVEVASLPAGEIGVRDSQDPGGPVLTFTRSGWYAFLGAARHRDFNGSGRATSRPRWPPDPGGRHRAGRG